MKLYVLPSKWKLESTFRKGYEYAERNFLQTDIIKMNEKISAKKFVKMWRLKAIWLGNIAFWRIFLWKTYLLRRGVLTVEIIIILLLVSVKVVLVTRSIPRIPRIWIPRVSSSVVWILVIISRILKIICGLSGRIWVFNSIFLVIIARTLVIIVEITIVFVFICEIIVWISATFIGIYGWWRLKRVIFLSIIKASQKGHFKKLDFF